MSPEAELRFRTSQTLSLFSPDRNSSKLSENVDLSEKAAPPTVQTIESFASEDELLPAESAEPFPSISSTYGRSAAVVGNCAYISSSHTIYRLSDHSVSFPFFAKSKFVSVSLDLVFCSAKSIRGFIFKANRRPLSAMSHQTADQEEKDRAAEMQDNLRRLREGSATPAGPRPPQTSFNGPFFSLEEVSSPSLPSATFPSAPIHLSQIHSAQSTSSDQYFNQSRSVDQHIVERKDPRREQHGHIEQSTASSRTRETSSSQAQLNQQTSLDVRKFRVVKNILFCDTAKDYSSIPARVLFSSFFVTISERSGARTPVPGLGVKPGLGFI